MNSSNDIKIPKEIERKFLVKTLPENLNNYHREEIRQGYLSISLDGTETRLRQKGNKFFKTVKKGAGKVRTELEVEITKYQFDSEWPLTEGKRIQKTRYEIPYENLMIELDTYHESLEGFVSVEVEFKNEEESNVFKIPKWFAGEITDDLRYKNQNLARFGIPK